MFGLRPKLPPVVVAEIVETLRVVRQSIQQLTTIGIMVAAKQGASGGDAVSQLIGAFLPKPSGPVNTPTN